MSQNIVIKSYDNLMHDIYFRVSNNIPFDKNLKIYNSEIINKVIKFFEEREEFEKCHKIKTFLELRFSHELNYLQRKP